jgi:SAM-dependent methyltransferase
MTDEYLAVNRAGWDERAPAHARSTTYGVARFATDPTFLSDVVRFDLPRLGDVSGLRGIHLQCHIGTDTISLARLGATMTGLDFSAPALSEARAIAATAGVSVDFVESDVYGALDVLEREAYDLVFTGIGALCWLPDIRRWAGIVSALLRPGGRLFIREGHPMLWTLNDDGEDTALTVRYAYFETDEPLVAEDEGTYVDTDVTFVHNVTMSWNHGLAEIMTALMAEGLIITAFEEHDSVPWDALPGAMHEVEGGEFRLTERPERLAASYTLQARKPA